MNRTYLKQFLNFVFNAVPVHTKKERKKKRKEKEMTKSEPRTVYMKL